MAQETQQTIVIQKNERDRTRICTLYPVTETTKFTLETCDGVFSTIKNMDKHMVAVLTQESPITVISGRGYYEVCIIGEGTGTVFAIPYAENNPGTGEDCCDELRTEINNLKNQITQLQDIINNMSGGGGGTDCCDELRTEINNLKTRVTNLENRVTNIENSGGTGTDCCDELRTEINNLKTRVTNLENRLSTVETQVTNITNRFDSQTFTGGTGISITKNGDNYTITNTLPGSTACCDEITNRINNMTFTGGTGISITKNGDNYTITNTLPGDGSGGGSTACCEEITNRINNMTFTGGTDITVTKNGDNYVFNYTGTGNSDCCEEITNRINNMTFTGGTDITVTKSGDNYTISYTGTGNSDCCEEITNRINNMTFTGGTGISITKNGDNYTIINTLPGNGTPSDIDIQQGENVQVVKSGNTYTISATDTKPDVTKQYVDDAIAGISDTNTVTTVTGGTGVTVTDSGTNGNHNYTINAERPVLTQALTSTCDIGSITNGTVYPVGTPLETILRALLNCPNTPTPSNTLPWFTSEVTDTSTWAEQWNQFDVDSSLGQHTFDLARTYEEVPVKFDVPASLGTLTIQLYNNITGEWVVNTRDFSITNVTRSIGGVDTPYLRYTDAREVNAGTRPVRVIWTP